MLPGLHPLQLASAVSIEACGGPFIPLRLGRKDANTKEDCTPDGRLPAAGAPFPDGAPTPAQHLRNTFYRMGLTDKDIVVLSGAHTVGRARPERRSACCPCRGASFCALCWVEHAAPEPEPVSEGGCMLMHAVLLWHTDQPQTLLPCITFPTTLHRSLPTSAAALARSTPSTPRTGPDHLEAPLGPWSGSSLTVSDTCRRCHACSAD
jgi:hypothetical protein